MPFKDREKRNSYQREYLKKYHKKYKLLAIKKLGGKCVNCGCDDINALEFNHINGGGAEEFRTSHNNQAYYYDIVMGRRTDIELTCRVCNALHCLVKLRGLPNLWKVTYTPCKHYDMEEINLVLDGMTPPVIRCKICGKILDS